MLKCPKCHIKNLTVQMKPIKRKGGFHKQTKFICPLCGLTRMKKNK